MLLWTIERLARLHLRQAQHLALDRPYFCRQTPNLDQALVLWEAARDARRYTKS